MAVYEVFIKRPGRPEHSHAGSLEAASEELALVLAREAYLRRAEGDRFWLVERGDLLIADTDFVAPNATRGRRFSEGAVEPLAHPEARELILAFADDEHLMGQQHAEWIGASPFLEEGVVSATLARDELEHGTALYALLVGSDSADPDEAVDVLALDREPADYRSCHLVEYQAMTWAEHFVRHFLYDAAEDLRWELFSRSSEPRLAALASAVTMDESFHRRHADGVLDVFLQSAVPRREVYAALRTLLPMALAMFEPVSSDTAAIEAGVVAGPFSAQLPAWSERVTRVFTQVVWDVEPVEQAGRTQRSEWFSSLRSRVRQHRVGPLGPRESGVHAKE